MAELLVFLDRSYGELCENHLRIHKCETYHGKNYGPTWVLKTPIILAEYRYLVDDPIFGQLKLDLSL